ncbi:MAG: AMP-binding protein [Meiothermus sp.]|uniref:AMP-binding protein n=1 Tax=Meiothermus sp. TaxID=1955249 RepID=UPI00298EE0EC|nr:AMP-binding protein [Meiothermus sp.]MDW8481138.1 AMP-binding protein [Meiothermus sp.]
MGHTAHVDTFARDNLPPRSEWPELIFKLPELAYPERLNAATELLDRMAERHPERTCLLAPGIRWSYRELLEKANRIAHVLVEDMGLVPGNRVLLRAPNHPMLVAAWFAVLKAGGIAVTTMPLLRSKELTEVITKAQVSHALCDARLGEELENASSGLPQPAAGALLGRRGRPGGADGGQAHGVPKPRHSQRRRGPHRLYLRHHRQAQGLRALPPRPAGGLRHLRQAHP